MTEETEISFPLAFAKKCSARIQELLGPYSELLHEVGSVRREKIFVKDIEFCAIPKKEFVKTGLFGEGFDRIDPGFVEGINTMKIQIVKGNFMGRYMQILIKGNIKFDLFMPERNDYYRQMVIRTGPAEFSHKIIANRWTELGWVGTPEGLSRKKDCYPITNKSAGKITGWRVMEPNGEHPPAWISEKDFFEWLGLDFIEPKYR